MATISNRELKDGDIPKNVPIPTSWRHPVPQKRIPGVLATNTITCDQNPMEFKKNLKPFHYTRQLMRRAARHGATQNAFGERKKQKKTDVNNNDNDDTTFNPFSSKNISAAICVFVAAIYIVYPERTVVLFLSFILLHFLHWLLRFAFIRFRFWEKRLTPDRSHRAAIADKGSYFDAYIRVAPSYRRSDDGDALPPMNDHGVVPEPTVISPSGQQSFYANSTMTEVYFMGYSRPGLTLADFMKVTMTVGLEFRANALARAMMYDMGLTRIAQQTTTQRVLFDCCLSTALACYADPACNDHLVFHNTTLPYRSTEKKCWDLIIFIIDYENERLKGIVTCEKADPRRGEIIPPPNALVRLAEVALKENAEQKYEIPPSGILELNTDDAEESVANRFNLDRDKAHWPKCNLVVSDHELGCLVISLVAWKAHVSTHWMASGVGDARSCWPLANTCNEVTQYFNSQSTFSSHIPMGNASTDQLYMLAKNPLTEGLPMHSHLSKYATKSKLRRISGPARTKLRELWGPGVSHAIIEAVLAATIFHAVDHYYCDLTSFNGVSAFLENDLSLFRLVLVGPCTYYSRNLLVRQHLDDPVCQILHECCKAVDPYLADHCLFLGICN